MLPHGPPFQAALPYVRSPSSSVVSAADRERCSPIEPENDESTKICCGVFQVAPPSVERVKNVCDL